MAEARYLIPSSGKKAAAKLVFQATLHEFQTVDLLKRSETQQFSNLPLFSGKKTRGTIYAFPITYLGSNISLVVYRLKDAPWESVAYALLNDTANAYQAISIDEVIEAIAEPRFKLETNLARVVEAANNKRQLMRITGRSRP